MSNHSRIGWDELFMRIAFLYSERSTCCHHKVGVVFVRENRILAASYNGSPKNEPHCTEVGCIKRDNKGKRLPLGLGYCRGAHAELNAIAHANTDRVDLTGATVYCTLTPCYECMKTLVNLKIKEFVYMMENQEEDYKLIDLFKRHLIKVRKYKLLGEELQKAEGKDE